MLERKEKVLCGNMVPYEDLQSLSRYAGLGYCGSIIFI